MAFAVLLFSSVSMLGVAWFRIASAAIGIIVLHQIPSLLELIGIFLVAVGVALHQESDTTQAKRER